MDNHFTPEVIKHLRNSLKLTQSQFARKLKVDVLAVSRWERGVQRPSPAVRRRINRLLDKSDKIV